MSATKCSMILQQQTASNLINSKDLKLLESRVNRKTDNKLSPLSCFSLTLQNYILTRKILQNMPIVQWFFLNCMPSQGIRYL